jgi:type I restriction enzyme M protein
MTSVTLPHTSHADQLVEICREVFGRGESFARKITGRVDRPLQQIREFRNRKQPGIVVTVEVFKIIAEDCDLHTVLRLTNGTFTPYSPGTKTNVVFFTKGYATENVWIYDNRTNIPGITKKDRPLTKEYFTAFEKCYGKDPNGQAKRKTSDSPEDRWRKFSIAEVKDRDFKLDSLKWLRDESLDDADDLPPPEQLATDAISELENAILELNGVVALLENGGS